MGTEANRYLSGTRLAGLAADSHFLNRQRHGFASNDATHDQPEPGGSDRWHFSIFRADRVSVTSTRFVGGDWRWCLSGPDGAVLAEGSVAEIQANRRVQEVYLGTASPGPDATVGGHG